MEDHGVGFGMYLFFNTGGFNIQGTHKSAMNIRVMQSYKSLQVRNLSSIWLEQLKA